MGKRKETSSNSINQKNLNQFCATTYAISVLGGRWKLVILYKLERRTMRFGELKEHIPDISDRMLTLHLQEMEKDGLIIRKAYAEVPPRVEYSLTESARSLAPIWKQLEAWGIQHQNQ